MSAVTVEWILKEEETFCDEDTVLVTTLAEVIEVVSDSVNPALHELVLNDGNVSVVSPFNVELLVAVTLDGWVNAPGRGLNKSDIVNCGLLLGGVTVGWIHW